MGRRLRLFDFGGAVAAGRGGSRRCRRTGEKKGMDNISLSARTFKIKIAILLQLHFEFTSRSRLPVERADRRNLALR